MGKMDNHFIPGSCARSIGRGRILKVGSRVELLKIHPMVVPPFPSSGMAREWRQGREEVPGAAGDGGPGLGQVCVE